MTSRPPLAGHCHPFFPGTVLRSRFDFLFGADIGASFSHESLADHKNAGMSIRSIAATSGGTNSAPARDPAQFFTINKILGNNSRPTSLQLSAANDEPFGKTAFVQPEGQISTSGMKYRSIWPRKNRS